MTLVVTGLEYGKLEDTKSVNDYKIQDKTLIYMVTIFSPFFYLIFSLTRANLQRKETKLGLFCTLSTHLPLTVVT